MRRNAVCGFKMAIRTSRAMVSERSCACFSAAFRRSRAFCACLATSPIGDADIDLGPLTDDLGERNRGSATSPSHKR